MQDHLVDRDGIAIQQISEERSTLDFSGLNLNIYRNLTMFPY